MTDQPKLIPTVIGRIDPIIDAIRAGNYAETLRLTEAETARLTEIRDRLDREWRQAQGKSLAAYCFGEFLTDGGPGVMERLKGEVA